MIAPDSGLPSGVWGHPAQRNLLARGRSVVDQCSLYLLYSQEPPQPCQVPPGLSSVTRVRVRRAWKNRPEWSTMTWDCNGVGGKTLWCFWIKIKKMKTAHDKCLQRVHEYYCLCDTILAGPWRLGEDQSHPWELGAAVPGDVCGLGHQSAGTEAGLDRAPGGGHAAQCVRAHGAAPAHCHSKSPSLTQSKEKLHVS